MEEVQVEAEGQVAVMEEGQRMASLLVVSFKITILTFVCNSIFSRSKCNWWWIRR